MSGGVIIVLLPGFEAAIKAVRACVYLRQRYILSIKELRKAVSCNVKDGLLPCKRWPFVMPFAVSVRVIRLR